MEVLASGINPISAGDESKEQQAIQARKLMSRLDKGDAKLALLLNQMAEALTSILHQSRAVAAQSSKAEQDGEEFTSGDLGEFEDLIQDWLASVYDIQLTLRKAVRFLVLASQPPILTAAHSFVPGGGVNAAVAGKASSSTPTAATGTATQGANDQSQDSGELSLSALRLQHQAWKDLWKTLQDVKRHKESFAQETGGGKAAGSVLAKMLDEVLYDKFPSR